MAYIFKHYAKTTPTGTGIVFIAYKLPSYSITYNLTNLTSDSTNPTTIGNGETASIIITAPTGYNLPSKITVTGCEYTWEANTGVLDISNPTGNVTITAEGVAETYSVTVNLTGVTGDATNPTTVSYGGSATFKFTANENYALPAGVEQTGATSYNWNKTTGTLVLARITGAVTITIVGESTLTQLATPTGLTVDGTTVSWDAVENATSYDIYVDGEVYENTTGAVSNHTLTFSGGYNSITVNNETVTSPYTLTQDCTIQIDSNRAVTVNGVSYDSLPTSESPRVLTISNQDVTIEVAKTGLTEPGRNYNITINYTA